MQFIIRREYNYVTPIYCYTQHVLAVVQCRMDVDNNCYQKHFQAWLASLQSGYLTNLKIEIYFQYVKIHNNYWSFNITPCESYDEAWSCHPPGEAEPCRREDGSGVIYAYKFPAYVAIHTVGAEWNPRTFIQCCANVHRRPPNTESTICTVSWCSLSFICLGLGRSICRYVPGKSVAEGIGQSQWLHSFIIHSLDRIPSQPARD